MGGEGADERPELPPDAPQEATASARQVLLETLEIGPLDFVALRKTLGLGVKALESELRHLEKSLKAQGRKLTVEPAICDACDFVFKGREQKHLHPPGRCPKCKGSRISGPVIGVN